MDPEGTRNDAPPTVVDMSLSAIHGSTNGSGRKDSACGQDFQITLCVARRRLQAHGSRACNQKHRTEHPAHPNRGKRGPDIPPPPTVRKPPSPHRATSFCPHQPTCRPAPAPLLPAPATRFPHTGRHPRPAQPPKYRKISVRTKKFRRRTLHSLRFLLSLHPL